MVLCVLRKEHGTMLTKVKQISTFIENKKGHLAAFTDILAENNINIRAICVYDSIEYGILRLVVDDPYKASELFREAGHTVRMADVVVIEPLDQPGTMNKIFHLLADYDINIEYIYPYAVKDAPYMLILATSDPDKALTLISSSGFAI